MTVAVKNLGRPRVLQLGYGAFGPVHARAWLAHGFAGRLVIADPSPEARAQAARELPNVRIVEATTEVMTEVDIVDIVTPADCHAVQIAAALDAGCDVLVEKPLTLHTAEARTVAAHVARSGRLLQVGWLMRAHPLARALRHRMSGIGNPAWIDADFISLKRPRRDAGVLLNDAVHFIDLVCWLLDAVPEEVGATLRHPLGRAYEDIALVTLGFPGGVVARIEASCVLAGDAPDPVVPGGWSRKTIVVHTDTARLAADFMAGTFQHADARLEQVAGDAWAPHYASSPPVHVDDVSWDAVMAAQIGGFLDAVESRTPPAAGVQSGLVATAICEAARRSAQEKRIVQPEI